MRLCITLCFLSLSALTAAQDEKPKAAAVAPGGSVLLETDRGGAYFVSQPLMNEYDTLQRELTALRADMAALRVDRKQARNRLTQIQRNLRDLRLRMDATKVYVASTSVHTQKQTQTIDAGPDDLILIEAGSVEIRGWDKPQVQCVVEKVVLEKGEGTADDEFASIVPRLERVSSKQVFGFYHSIAEKPQWKDDWDRFLFKSYLGHEFIHITLAGLTAQEGNRFISLEAKNEQGAGVHWGEWRRHAQLIVYVPKCRTVGLIGGLQGFKSTGVRAPLILQGQGDRNYGATNVVSDHDGSIKAENLPLYDVAQIRGNVEIALLQFPGNYAETHDGDGVTVHAMPAPPAGFRNISGDLKIAITRGDLSISEVEGAVDISNDFGNTSWRVNKPLAARAHRVVSQSGEIEIRVAPQALDALPASFLTECGTIRVAAAIRGDINPVGTSFNGPFGSGPTRGWHGLSHAPKKNDAPNAAGAVGLIERVQQVLGEKERSAGLDVISHGGTIVVQ